MKTSGLLALALFALKAGTAQAAVERLTCQSEIYDILSVNPAERALGVVDSKPISPSGDTVLRLSGMADLAFNGGPVLDEVEITLRPDADHPSHFVASGVYSGVESGRRKVFHGVPFSPQDSGVFKDVIPGMDRASYNSRVTYAERTGNGRWSYSVRGGESGTTDNPGIFAEDRHLGLPALYVRQILCKVE
jgi:hypothetical protein